MFDKDNNYNKQSNMPIARWGLKWTVSPWPSNCKLFVVERNIWQSEGWEKWQNWSSKSRCGDIISEEKCSITWQYYWLKKDAGELFPCRTELISPQIFYLLLPFRKSKQFRISFVKRLNLKEKNKAIHGVSKKQLPT